MRREYYSDTIDTFLDKEAETILGTLTANHGHNLERSQRDAWLEEIRILKEVLGPYRHRGAVYFEYSIPRLGRRIDVVTLIDHVAFVLEFKIGERTFPRYAIDQVWDYALDLKNFHEPSHDRPVAPILVATKARNVRPSVTGKVGNDNLFQPILSNALTLAGVIEEVLRRADGSVITPSEWISGRYCPTPTIIEAATALYNGHAVEDISRSDASAVNLRQTSDTISEIIESARINRQKVLCFVTGVPGAGKTLVGLNIANKHLDKNEDLYSVFISGNGPLVAVLREALARDKVRAAAEGRCSISKKEALSQVAAFIQNVHHFRDECLVDFGKPPVEHVVLFDEAQRAWNLKQTAKFMQQRKDVGGFHQSEPEFLISCLDRHRDWAVIVCLVGGGQEINTGEAGISEWVSALVRAFPHWRICISPRLTDSEYASGEALQCIASRPGVVLNEELHLSVCMRSFRAEHVSLMVKQLLDVEPGNARRTLQKIAERYPITLTRDLRKAKRWLRDKARGSERYGILASSQAQRLKPHAIDVKTPIRPIHWFLDGKADVRSSYYLEDVATEFHIQGLEVDWACVTWDADFRYKQQGWQHWSFRGNRWTRIRKPERQTYLKNAYRVLLTRARQGMVIVVPEGDSSDPTRDAAFYDPTFNYLRTIGFQVI